MPFYIYAWLTNIFYAFGTLGAKLTNKHQITNPWHVTFFWEFFTLVLTIPFAIYHHVHLPTHWLPLLFLGLSSALSGTFYMLALNLLDISVLSPLYSFRSVFGVFFGVFLFREHLSLLQLLLIGIIFLGGLFVSMEERLSIRSFFRVSIIFAFLAVFMASALGASIKNAMRYDGFWEVVFWGDVFCVLFCLPTIALFRRDLRKIRLSQYKGTAIFSIFSFMGYLFSNVAYGKNVSITSAILSVPMSMIVAVLFSLVFPKLLEKHTLKIYAIRFSAAAVMILAAVRLTS